MQRAKALYFILIVLVLLGSFYLNIWNNDFGLLHIDEGFKIEGIIGLQKFDFHHPILIMQAVRLPNLFLKFSGMLEVARLGRTTTAVWGTLSVLFIFLIARRVLSRKFSLLVALAVATSPIMVIHAHYLKEDMVFCCFALMSLWRYMVYIKHQTRFNALWLGVAVGLMCSSQYKAALMIVLFILFPLVLYEIEYRKYYLHLGLIVFPLAIVLFSGINYSMFQYPGHAWAGFKFSTMHAVKGHELKIFPLDHWFLFHFRYSLIPGLTAGLTFLGAGAILLSMAGWRKLSNVERILLIYAVVFYLAVELTPLKPFPAFIRYVVPIAPIVIFFAFRMLAYILEKCPQKPAKYAVYALIAGLLIWPLYDTVKLTYYINKDTRDQIREKLKHSPGRYANGLYVFPYSLLKRVGDYSVAEWQLARTDFLVTSSFMYERYLYGLTLKNQDEEVYRIGRNYEEIFKYPYEEITPKFKSFAFSNPTLRIVDIRKRRRYELSPAQTQ